MAATTPFQVFPFHRHYRHIASVIADVFRRYRLCGLPEFVDQTMLHITNHVLATFTGSAAIIFYGHPKSGPIISSFLRPNSGGSNTPDTFRSPTKGRSPSSATDRRRAHSRAGPHGCRSNNPDTRTSYRSSPRLLRRHTMSRHGRSLCIKTTGAKSVLPEHRSIRESSEALSGRAVRLSSVRVGFATWTRAAHIRGAHTLVILRAVVFCRARPAEPKPLCRRTRLMPLQHSDKTGPRRFRIRHAVCGASASGVFSGRTIFALAATIFCLAWFVLAARFAHPTMFRYGYRRPLLAAITNRVLRSKSASARL
jgi:hypothetical protein